LYPTPKTVIRKRGLGRISLDLPAEVGDMRVDGSLEAVVGETERRLDELTPAERTPRLLRECREQGELPWRDLDRIAVEPNLVCAEVDLEQPDPKELGRGFARSGTAEHCANPRRKLARAERLDDVVVRPEVESDEDVVLRRAGTDDDDRHAHLVSEDPADVEAVHAGHHQVEHDQVGPTRASQFERPPAVGRKEDREVVSLEIQADDLRLLRIVFRYENPPVHVIREYADGRSRQNRHRFLTTTTEDVRHRQESWGKPGFPHEPLLEAPGRMGSPG
jgi:hypothetical protein